MRYDPRPLAMTATCLATLAFVGCERVQPKVVPPRPPAVTVSLPTTDDVRDFEEFPGRTEAVYSIEIRSRVTGYLVEVHFKDGDEVDKDAPLFDIDPRPF